jgi:citronellol/citronellal dehydrogenase
MSLMTKCWAEEFKEDGIASNTLWPATTIATAAVKNIMGGEELIRRSRKPEIVADAAFYILQKDAKTNSGNSYLDEEVLRSEGITDLEPYSIIPGGVLQPDLFL